MKVYSCPKEVSYKIDYRNFDVQEEIAREEEHTKKLAAWLKERGYTGKHTGEIVRFGVADGYAQYMLADGPKSCLIHLPYSDAYQYRDAEFLPKKEIIRRIEAEKKFQTLWKKDKVSA